VRAIRDVATTAEAEGLVEPGGSGVLAPETKPVEVAAGERDGLLHEPTTQPVPPVFGQDVHVPHPPHSGVVEKRVNVQPAHTDESAIDLCREERLAGT
jgi:hypothetical protein